MIHSNKFCYPLSFDVPLHDEGEMLIQPSDTLDRPVMLFQSPETSGMMVYNWGIGEYEDLEAPWLVLKR